MLRKGRIEFLGRSIERGLIRVSGTIDDVPSHFQEELPDGRLAILGLDEFKDRVTEMSVAVRYRQC